MRTSYLFTKQEFRTFEFDNIAIKRVLELESESSTSKDTSHTPRSYKVLYKSKDTSHTPRSYKVLYKSKGLSVTCGDGHCQNCSKGWEYRSFPEAQGEYIVHRSIRETYQRPRKDTEPMNLHCNMSSIPIHSHNP